LDLSIIIVSYNTHSHLRNCLNSVSKNLKDLKYEIIVVDNNSTDREIESFPVEYPSVKFFLRENNDGFGNGCNYGAKTANGKYLLFLNPDIKLIDNSVKKLYEYLKNHSDCGIVSGLMVDDKGDVLYGFNEYPSFSWEIYQFLGYGYERKIKKLINKKEIRENHNFETDWFHGAIFMISKSDFEKLGGFNERYFMYYEDVEICYKVKMDIRKKIVCIPSVRVFHHTQSSLASESNDNIFIFHMHRSKIIFFRNYFFLKRFILLAFGVLYALSRIILLPFWKKYKKREKEKFIQLTRVLKLYLNPAYVGNSKYEYINR
jgi:GT2 family glycosyltransferase